MAIFSPQFNLSPSSFGENVRTLLHVGRLTRKSIPLGPQSTPLGPRLLTHLVTWPNLETLKIAFGRWPQAILINISLGRWPREILRVSRLGLMTWFVLRLGQGGWILGLGERISRSLPPFSKVRLQSQRARLSPLTI